MSTHSIHFNLLQSPSVPSELVFDHLRDSAPSILSPPPPSDCLVSTKSVLLWQLIAPSLCRTVSPRPCPLACSTPAVPTSVSTAAAGCISVQCVVQCVCGCVGGCGCVLLRNECTLSPLQMSSDLCSQNLLQVSTLVRVSHTPPPTHPPYTQHTPHTCPGPMRKIKPLSTSVSKPEPGPSRQLEASCLLLKHLHVTLLQYCCQGFLGSFVLQTQLRESFFRGHPPFLRQLCDVVTERVVAMAIDHCRSVILPATLPRAMSEIGVWMREKWYV